MDDPKKYFIESLEKVLKQEGAGINVYFALQKGVKRANIQNKFEASLAQELAQELGKVLVAAKEEETSIIDFSTSDNRGKVFLHWDLEQDSPVGDVFSKLQGVNEYFSMEDLSSIKGVACRFGTEECYLLTHRRFFSINLYKSDRSLLYMSGINGKDKNKDKQLVPFNKDLVKIESKVDWICFVSEDESEEFIIDTKAIEKDESYKNKLKEMANNHINVLVKNGFLKDSGELEPLSNNPTYAKKIIAISKRKELNDVKPEQLKDYIKSIPKIADAFDFDKDNRPNLSSKDKRKLYVDVLNDDIFMSGLTKIAFRNLRKDKL